MASMRSEGSPLEGDRPYMSERLMIHNRDREQCVGVGPVNYGLLDNHNFACCAQVPKNAYSLGANYDEDSATNVSEPNPPLHNQSARSDDRRSGWGCGSGMGCGWQK